MKNWSCHLLNHQEILNQFRQYNKFTVEHDGTWYNKFKYKLEFDFSMLDLDGRKSWRLNNYHNKMIEEFKENLWEFRKRREVFQTFFTNDSELIEHVLNDSNYMSHLHTVYYTSVRYNTNKSKLEQHGIITDIKFRREVGKWKYQIYFGDWDYRDKTIQEGICEYIAKSYVDGDIVASAWNEDLIKRYIKHKIPFMHNGFSCYMKDEDEIMILHFIAPGRIKKVFQIMEKIK